MVAADAHDRGPGKVGVTGACLCHASQHLRAKWFLFGSAAFAIATVFISLSCSAAPSDSEVQFVVTKLPVLIGHDIRFTRLSTQDGLSQSRVEHIVQDDQGFMWFGTDDGLNRYDGYTFKVFRHDRDETNSLGGAEVRALFKDRSGALWIGVDQVLDRFDPATETFTHYRTDPKDPNSLGGVVYSICQDSAGFLWMATSRGLSRLDPASGRFTHYRHSADDPATISSDDLTFVMMEKTGFLWVVSTVGLDTVNPQTGLITRYAQFQGSLKVAFHPDIALRPDIALYEDLKGGLWVISTSAVGLAEFDRKTRAFTIYSFHQDEPDPRSVVGVSDICEDAEGMLWLATVGSGLIKFNQKSRTFTQYTGKPGVATSLSNNFVLSLFRDREGNMWAGTGGGGVDRFRGGATPFLTYRKEPGNPNSLDQNFVLSVYEDSQGIVWIGNANVLNRLDRKTGRFSFYRHDPGDHASISDGTVTATVEDHSGMLWFATYGGGLNEFDRATGRFKKFRSNPSDPRSLSSDRILTMLLDRAGTIWIGTGNVLDRFDPETERFTKYLPPQPSPISQIIEDHDGSLWLGTVDQGLSHFFPAAGRFISYRHNPGTLRDLSNNHINALCLDQTGALWIGTEDGLDRFDTRSSAVTASFYRRNGLANHVVQGIKEDAHGNLWVSTNGGLSMLQTQTGKFTNYYESDGLAGNDFGVFFPVAYQSSRGELFFGGVDGVTSFYPDEVLKAFNDSFMAPVVLTDFQLFSGPVPIGRDSPLHKTISHVSSLTLSPKQNVFSLEFSALSYTRPESTRYRYKLEGLQKDWYETDSNHRFVTYTTLPPGDYRFRVQAAANLGPWNEEGASLHITILPPWWATWWFRVISIAAFVLVLLGLYVFRLRQIAHEFNLGLEERVHERTRIARELHDTLLQSFQGVLLLFQAVSNQLEPGKTKQKLDRAIDRAQEAIIEGRDAVQGLRAPPLESNDLAEAIRTLGDGLAAPDASGNSASFHVQVEGAPRELYPTLRDEVYRIAAEGLRNAFRHANAKRIEVEIRYDERRLRVLVRDDGKGIDTVSLRGDGREGHYGLRGMRERAKLLGGQLSVWSALDAGTEVELSIPGARIYIASREGRRSWFAKKASGKNL